MLRPKRKPLTSVSIGSYKVDNFGRSGIEVNNGDACVKLNAVYDQRMGPFNRTKGISSDMDYAAMFGSMGYIPLNSSMVSPVMERPLVQYLSIYAYVFENEPVPYLKMREGISTYIRKHDTLKGYRKLKAISEDIIKPNPWKMDIAIGGVKYKFRNKKAGEKESDVTISISGNELRLLLERSTQLYTKNSSNVDNPPEITLETLGMNTEVSKPEDWVIGVIPMIPNGMRAPLKGSRIVNGCATGTLHAFTNRYSNIIRLVKTGGEGSITEIRKEYLNLIKNGEEDTLESTVFSSKKKAFIRGGMLSKVGGQIGRSVVAPNSKQSVDQVGIPRSLALDLSVRISVTNENLDEVTELFRIGHITHIFHIRTGEYIRVDQASTTILQPGRMLVIRELQDDDVVLLNRQPTLHRNSILGFRVYLHDEDVIYVHPSAVKSFGMDLKN